MPFKFGHPNQKLVVFIQRFNLFQNLYKQSSVLWGKSNPYRGQNYIKYHDSKYVHNILRVVENFLYIFWG